MAQTGESKVMADSSRGTDSTSYSDAERWEVNLKDERSSTLKPGQIWGASGQRLVTWGKKKRKEVQDIPIIEKLQAKMMLRFHLYQGVLPETEFQDKM